MRLRWRSRESFLIRYAVLSPFVSLFSLKLRAKPLDQNLIANPIWKVDKAMDAHTCVNAFSAQVWRYNILVAVALVGVLGKMALCKQWKVKMGWPDVVAGCMTIVVAISLLTVFWPSCPEKCTCRDFFALFPFLSLLMGIGWIHDGSLAVAGYKLRNARETIENRIPLTKLIEAR